jgi:sortase A
VTFLALSRILGAIGRTMISAGVLLLLFVIYQLWGTGFRTGAEQSGLRDDFQARKAELARATTTAPPTTVATTGPRPTAPVTPSTAAPTPPARIGDAIGVIRIPRIGVDFTIVEGVDLNNLARGPGHFPDTPLPGQAGNAAVAGHRVTHSAPFNRLDELVPGDQILVETFQGPFTYEIVPEGGVGTDPAIGHRIIAPTQTEILDQPPGQNIITLMACHPKYDLKERIVVVGRLVEPPAATTPRAPDPAPGAPLPAEQPPASTVDATLVGGDSGAIGPSLLWSLLAGTVWLVTWLIARRYPSWRRWERWVIFAGMTPTFAIFLFLAFEQLNDLLPAGY